MFAVVPSCVVVLLVATRLLGPTSSGKRRRLAPPGPRNRSGAWACYAPTSWLVPVGRAVDPIADADVSSAANRCVKGYYRNHRKDAGIGPGIIRRPARPSARHHPTYGIIGRGRPPVRRNG